MIIVPLIPFRRRRKGGGAPQTPPQTLVLVSANFDETVRVLTLVFDRAIDASGFVAGQVIVADGSFEDARYGGVGPATVEGPARISVALEYLAPAPPAPAVTLTASALTGLVAVDDGGTWAGVNELELPFDG